MVFYLLAAVSLGFVIVAAVLAIRWYARFGRLHFAQLGEKASAKMQKDYTQSRH